MAFSSKQLGQHILASYYNDARLNILACLNDIREKSGKRPIENEDQIKHAFTDLALSKATPERQTELIKQLRHRFHFLDLLTDASPQVSQKKKQDNATPLPHYYESHLTWMLELVNGLRNTMAHPVDKEITIAYAIHKKLYFALSKLYDSSFHTVKTRFSHETNAMQPFQRCGRDGKPKPAKQFAFALCTDPLDLSESSDLPQSKVLHDFGHILFCSLFLEKSQSAELINYFWQTQQGSKWGDTVQRTIIREMIAVYRVRLPIQRLKSDDTSTAVTLDTLSELSRCPRALLDALSPDDQARFRGDASNNDNADEADADTSENTYLFARSRQERFIPLMMRFFDFNPANKLRFAVDLGQFYYNVRLKPASQFTDETARVRRLGQKILAYGCLSDFDPEDKPADWRQLEDNYKVSRDEEEQTLQNATDTMQILKPYVVPTYPHYHYFDDKIGFRLENKATTGYPDLQALAADSAVILDSPAGRDMMPEFWVSPAQLLSLVFYSQLQPASPNQQRYLALDILLTKYRVGMKNLLNALAHGNVSLSGVPHSAERREQAQQWVDKHFDHNAGTRFAVPLSHLPKVVIQHLLGAEERQVAVAEVVARAEHLLAETQHKQDQLKQLLQHADKKRGQKGFKAIKCGHIGDFLTDDLMRFQPVDADKSDGGKINSQQYQILQAALAYYGAHINEPPKVVDLLRDAGLLQGKFAHPFIAELNLESQPNQYRGLISFYEAYLKARARYLNGFIKELRQRRTVTVVPQWLRLRQPSSLQNWLNEQWDANGNLTQPLPLMDNMLYPPILALVGEALDIDPHTLEREGMQRFTRGDEEIAIPPAVTWLIKRYLGARGDTSQLMYQYPRRHGLFDTWLDKRTPKQRFQEKPTHYLPEAERQAYRDEIRHFVQTHTYAKPADAERREKLGKLLKAYQRDEQTIRHSVSQDMLLYLSARQYLESLHLSNGGLAAKPAWSLQGIEKTLLKTEIHYALPVAGTDKQVFHPACKIRNLGELGLLVRDRRLPSLLRYYSDDESTIHHAEIRAELNSYRRAKVAVMAMVHELEKTLLKVLGDIPERTKEQEKQSKDFGKGRHGDFLFALYQQQRQRTGNEVETFSPARFKRTLLIRNAFSHNQYPDAAAFIPIAAQVQGEAVPSNPANHRKVAERLMQEMENLYSPWMRYLRQYKAE
jgi:hypothetical protein